MARVASTAAAEAALMKALYDEHAAVLWRYALRLTGDAAQAEDVVQETLLRAWQHPEVVGEPYEDADGTRYLSEFRQPVMVFEGGKELLTAARAKALARGLDVAVFTADMFGTGNDAANRAAVRAVRGDDLDLVGIAVYGPKNAVDKAFKGAAMHH